MVGGERSNGLSRSVRRPGLLTASKWIDDYQAEPGSIAVVACHENQVVGCADRIVKPAKSMFPRRTPRKRALYARTRSLRDGRQHHRHGARANDEETVPNMGVVRSVHGRPGGRHGMAGDDRTLRRRRKEADPRSRPWRLRRPPSTLDPLGLTLDDGKALLSRVQRHLVQARVAEYSTLHRRCSHCRRLRPLKDTHTRRLNRARRFLSEFFPIGDDPPWQETIRRRTAKVGAAWNAKPWREADHHSMSRRRRSFRMPA